MSIGLLRDLAHVHLPTGRRVMSVEVHDERGEAIYRGTMTIVGEVITQPEPPDRA